MKTILSTLAIAFSLQAHASTLIEYDLTKLSDEKADKIDQLPLTLAQTLNAIQHCPKEIKDKLNFGQALTSLEYAGNRNGNRDYTLVATGKRPAPSFKDYEVTIAVKAEVIPVPIAPDAPTPYKYTCKITEK